MSGRVSDEAGAWDARLRAPDCTEEDRASFAAWRDADPVHREAFERLQALVGTLRQHGGRADVRALREEALRASRHHRRRFWCGVAVAGLGALGMAAVFWNSSAIPDLRPALVRLTSPWWGVERFSTGVGQRSTFALEDGSSVELDAQSQIRVSFTASRRDVELVRGQALFSVAKSPQRPFVVTAGERQIVAVGTLFDVRLDKRSVQVTLLEGRVRVSRTGEAAGVLLTPGRQLIAPAAGVEVGSLAAGGHSSGEAAPDDWRDDGVIREVDVAKVTGWREGRVFLEDLPLADAIAEMNRHSAVQVRLDGVRLGIRINGMFRAGDQQAFVTALESYLPLTVEHRDESEIVLMPRR